MRSGSHLADSALFCSTVVRSVLVSDLAVRTLLASSEGEEMLTSIPGIPDIVARLTSTFSLRKETVDGNEKNNTKVGPLHNDKRNNSARKIKQCSTV